MSFVIDPQLRADTHPVGTFDASYVLLHKNAVVPWLILVPGCRETEFLALSTGLRERLLDESAQTAKFIQSYFGSSKINFAAIGNVVPQLHLHVVGRTPGDACWPAPVWGNLIDFKPYFDSEVRQLIKCMLTECRLKSFKS
jgi:diadenosine tetraphosphate (Ap4A) HIT family hydrolase